jgi:hypothetical protein
MSPSRAEEAPVGAPDVLAEAERRGIELVARPTAEACALLTRGTSDGAAAVLHVTC